MKRLLNNIPTFDIDVLIDELNGGAIESSADPSNYYIPSGRVIEDIKDNDPQVIADYDAFVETIEDLLIDYYHFELTYYDDNENNSRYYNFLAKDSEGNITMKFRLRLRISNHVPHRTQKSQKKKNSEIENSREELHKFLNDNQISKLKAYTKVIIINNKEYDSYEEAFIDIDKMIERFVEVMNK